MKLFAAWIAFILCFLGMALAFNQLFTNIVLGHDLTFISTMCLIAVGGCITSGLGITVIKQKNGRKQ